MSNGKSVAAVTKDAIVSTIVMVAAGAAVVYMGQYIWGPNSWLSPDSFRKRKRSLDGLDDPTVNDIPAFDDAYSPISVLSKRSLPQLLKRDLDHEMQDLSGHTL